MKVRQPAVQGAFYPDDPAELTKMVDGFLAKPPETVLPAGRVRAVVAPHAGYIYSGMVAAQAIGRIPKDTTRVIILAPSHHVGFANGAMADAGVFANALGNVLVDPATFALCTDFPNLFKAMPAAHSQEHSLEVMIPFLQRHLGHFTLVPIVVGQRLDAAGLAKALAPLLADEKTALIASSDLSHYHPYAEAKTLDQAVIRRVVALDLPGLMPQEEELCGKAPVSVLIELAKAMKWQPTLVSYKNSGDTAGDRSKVVGYVAIAFLAGAAAPATAKPAAAAAPATPEAAAAPATPEAAAASEQRLVSQDDQKQLLTLARQTIVAKLRGQSLPDLPTGAAVLKQKLGCFVTLKKQGELRGCIGNIFPVHPLAEGIRSNALSAAFEDPRFPPVRLEEMAAIDVEISVLTLPEKLTYKNADDLLRQLRPGVDGVVLTQNIFRQSTFLPQVWEQIAEKVTFLEHLCRKGGMDGDAWRDPAKMDVKTYQAFVFGEKAGLR